MFAVLACEKVDTILIEPDITLDLENVALLVGEEQQLQVTYKEAGVEVANSGVKYTWSSSDNNVSPHHFGALFAVNACKSVPGHI